MTLLNVVLNIMTSIDLQKNTYFNIIIFDQLMKKDQVYAGYDDKIEMLKQISTCKNRILKWNKDRSQWIEIENLIHAQPHSLESIRTLSFNVLFDRLHQLGRKGCMEHVLNSKQRFAYTLKQIQEMDPDIVGLQEVTQVFFEMLLKCEWAKNKYWISNNLKYNQGFGNVLMSKIQPICIVPMKIKSLPRMAWTGFFPLKAQTTKIFTFTSVHLIAYDKNSDIRQKQFSDLIRNLNQYSKIVQDNVIQGDLNFHAQIETETSLKHGLTDSWLERYQGNLKQYPGYTFNSDKNSLINELYWGFQRRKMRLDRIFYLGNIFFTEEIKIVFDKSLKNQNLDEGQNVDKHMFLKGGLLYVGDYFGWNIREDMEKKLFASDHFGLLATLKFKKKSEVKKILIV